MSLFILLACAVGLGYITLFVVIINMSQIHNAVLKDMQERITYLQGELDVARCTVKVFKLKAMSP